MTVTDFDYDDAGKDEYSDAEDGDSLDDKDGGSAVRYIHNA